MTNNEITISDAETRRVAESAFDHNVVVVAGAGTGKTTLLVNRLVHVLMRAPDPVDVTRLVALTFTNKAATEMKVRLRERLTVLLDPEREEAGLNSGWVRAADLRERYALSNEALAERARQALGDLEKAQIGTLHSFAAHVLRLYPIESGVDPSFREDDGLRFAEHFTEQWDLWLDRELGAEGPHAEAWRALLRETDLETLREVTVGLCSELVPLEDLIRQAESETLPPALRQWLSVLREQAADLLAAHPVPSKPRNVERALGAAHEILGRLLAEGPASLADVDDRLRGNLGKEPGSCPRGWDDAAFGEAERLIKVTRRTLEVDQPFWRTALPLLVPFVEHVRDAFVRQGWLSFDGLLARARRLLRDHPAIRERLKQQYHAILVDEFQDTDPVQYELVLYLAERAGRCATSWGDVDLQPGKLFIVGDPKQSIYAFRRADIEAFDRVVQKICTSGGVVHDLVTNFRSHRLVLEAVNAVFDRLLRPRPNLQPPNIPLQARPDRRASAVSAGVELRVVVGRGDEALDADAARRLEAEQLATWMEQELLGAERLTDEQGRVAPLRPGHVALLFRKLTQAQDYLDALRRHGIHYVTDGEKHFYRRQEVIDLVNVLRVLEDPHDGIALLGVLRSPLGGLTDREIYELREHGAFDYRDGRRLQGWAGPQAAIVRALYERLAELARASAGLALPDVIDLVLDRLAVRELAAASLHGEQALANLWKVRQIAVELSDRPQLTLSGFVELMIARLQEQPEESEGALAEESLDAVRVLTIHKAKGLEFPVVIVPGLQQGDRTGGREPIITQDWSSGMLGLAVGGKRTLAAVMVGEKARAREEAERRRLFYVAMTRARERLVLSGGLVGRRTPGSMMALLMDASDSALGDPTRETVSIGSVTMPQAVIRVWDQAPRRTESAAAVPATTVSVTDLLAGWAVRDQAWETARNRRNTVTPTALIEEAAERARQRGHVPGEAQPARLIGTLAHRVLQDWDFRSDPVTLGARVEAVCRAGIPPEQAHLAMDIRQELQAMLATFVASEPYRELSRAEILGREVPFAIAWEGERRGAMGYGPEKDRDKPPLSPIVSSPLPVPCLMCGMIDVLYRLDGGIWVADYKTDRVAEEELPDRIAQYRPQAEAYREAVSRSLGGPPVGFRFIFLRSGQWREV